LVPSAPVPPCASPTTPDREIAGVAPPVDASGEAALTSVTPPLDADCVLASPNGSSGSATFRALVAADLPSLPGGSGSVNPSITTPVVAFNAELFLGPDGGGYSYSSGGAGYFYHYPFDTTVSRLWMYLNAVGVNLTIRLRDSAGTQLWAANVSAGSSSYSASPDLAVPAGTLVQFSVAPASGTPTLSGAYTAAVGVL
jgi:hypothetical protein